MTDEQGQKAFEIYVALSRALKALVSSTLEGEDSEVEEQVRERLNDEFRFWDSSSTVKEYK